MVAIGGVVVALVVLGWAAGGFFGDGTQVEDKNASARESQPPSSPPPPSPPGSSHSSTTSAPAPTPTTPTTTTSPPPPPPDPNLPCADTAMQVTVELGAPQYRVGQRPVLRLVIANAGAVPCTRDISRALREVVVTSVDGVNRLWSSRDCYGSSRPDLRIMQPGERQEFEVKWAGRTSAPGCPSSRTTVQAGTYSVIGKLGPLTSPAVPLAMV
ncbi:hypothetical protein [Kibdelosporangium phytohabitans]|uniref:MucR family transcriptional regulator n=1 Tax=Kibdelosporangium phytohabitans TaxID=860235 RepID=A0A0N7F2I3_9PSEU|nr:hypothetical protein [Kibdelosporangium phytohabitans]ALG05911.1 hypothetical protein AOZ06_02330 [Kibdelosporangium phytohabitans]MBE1466044.1 hypothetical protein [Kibdelosporangium phytohabitans]